MYILQNCSLNDLEQAKTQDRESLAQRFQDYREGQYELEKRDRQKLLDQLYHLPFRVQLELVEHSILKSINQQHVENVMKIDTQRNDSRYQDTSNEAEKLYQDDQYLLSVYIRYHNLRHNLRNGLEQIEHAKRNKLEESINTAIEDYHTPIDHLKKLYKSMIDKLEEEISAESDPTKQSQLSKKKDDRQKYIDFLDTVEDQYHKKHVAELKQLLIERYELNKTQLANDPNYEEKLPSITETYNNDLAILPIQYAKVLGWIAREELASDIDLLSLESTFDNWK